MKSIKYLVLAAACMALTPAQATGILYKVNFVQPLNARDTDFASRTFAAAHTAKRKCVKTCRARYRDCPSLKQIPSSECRGIYQDCTRYTCNAGQAMSIASCEAKKRRSFPFSSLPSSSS